MKYILIFFIITVLISGCTTTKKNEKYYQSILCNELNGKMEYKLNDKSRVDCLTNEYAIEVDWAKKWPEAIGQSLYYSEMTNKKPAIALIYDENKDEIFLERVNKLVKKHHLKLFRLKK